MRLACLRACALTLLATGCTFVSDFAVHQCESSSDCDVLDGRIRRCVDSQCIEGCESNHQCSSFDPRAPLCPAVGSQCVSLTSDEGSCYVSSTYDDATMGALLGSDLTVIGAFAPTLSSSTWLTLELAVDELNAASASGASALAPTLAVLCRGGDEIIASVDHLVNGLHAPGIVASLEAVPLEALHQDPDLTNRTLLLSPYGTGAGREPDPWTWHLGGDYADAVGPFLGLSRELGAAIEQRLVPRRGLRIASLISEAPEDLAFSEAVEASLQIDGRTTDYLFREDRFRRFRLGDDSPEARALLPAAIAAYAPDLLLVFLGGEFRVPRGEPRLGVLEALEAQAAEHGAWSPVYLLGPRARADDRATHLAKTNDRFRASAVGVSVDRVPDEDLRQGLLARYTAAFPAAAPAGLFPADSTYDAIYYLAYATALARTRGEPQLTPESLLDGLARITNARDECVEVGPAGNVAAAERMRDGSPFQLCGVTGPARFSPDGARRGQAQLSCWRPPDAVPTVDAAGVSAPRAECAALLATIGSVP